MSIWCLHCPWGLYQRTGHPGWGLGVGITTLQWKKTTPGTKSKETNSFTALWK